MEKTRKMPRTNTGVVSRGEDEIQKFHRSSPIHFGIFMDLQYIAGRLEVDAYEKMLIMILSRIA